MASFDASKKKKYHYIMNIKQNEEESVWLLLIQLISRSMFSVLISNGFELNGFCALLLCT